MSVAKSLVAGHILEDQLFPYPQMQVMRDCRNLTIFEGTNEVLRLYIALSALKDLGKALGDKFLSTLPQLLRQSVGIYPRYTVDLPKPRQSGTWPVTYGVRNAMRMER